MTCIWIVHNEELRDAHASLNRDNSGDKIEEGGMGGASVSFGGEEMHTGF
jgi:hypothetical protein